MKKRVRAVGIIFLNGGIVLMHRKNIRYRIPKEYYVLPGITCNQDMDLEKVLQEEILQEIGLNIKVKNLKFNLETNQTKEYFYICEYISGKFGNVKNIATINDLYSSKSTPEIVRKEEFKKLYVMPEGIKEKLLEEMSWSN